MIMKMKIVRNSFMPIPVAILLVSLPVLMLMCGAEFPSRYILEIVDAKNGNSIFQTEACPRDRFRLEYVHSVQLSRVIDLFEIDRRHEIVLVGTTFSDHGAGLPYKPYHRGKFSVLPDGKFHISDMYVILPEIRLRVGREHDNAFECDDRRINLSRRCGNALLIIRTRKYSILKRLLRK